MEISKIIIPAAGLGTRFLPFTKTIPKEMLPFLNKPAIQHVVEESYYSELANLFIIVGKNKNIISDYFDNNDNINSFLKERDKLDLVSNIDKIIRQIQINYVRQAEPLGLGHAILAAKGCIHKEYFGIALPDDVIIHKQPALAQLIRVARQEKASVVAVQEVPAESVSSYGIVAIKKQITPNLFQLSHMVEKPQPKDAPSSLAIVGRYVLSNKIFNSLETISSYECEELQLTDAISHMMQQNERVFAYKVQGARYDIGAPLNWLKSIISYSLQDPYYGPYLQKYLSELQQNLDIYSYNPAKILENNL